MGILETAPDWYTIRVALTTIVIAVAGFVVAPVAAWRQAVRRKRGG
jgi:hypothetical protein